MPLEAKQREYLDKIVAFRAADKKAKAERQAELDGLALDDTDGANQTYKLGKHLEATGRTGAADTPAARDAREDKAEAHKLDVLYRVEDGINVGRITEKQGQASAADHKLARERIVDAPVLPGDVVDTPASKLQKENARAAMQKQRAAEELVHTLLDKQITAALGAGPHDKETIRTTIEAAIHQLIHDHANPADPTGVLQQAVGMVKANGDYWLAHFVSRHGPDSTRDEQVTRVVTGHPADAPRPGTPTENVALAAGPNADVDSYAVKGRDFAKTSSRFDTASSELFAVEQSLAQLEALTAVGGALPANNNSVIIRKSATDTDTFGDQYKSNLAAPPNLLTPADRSHRAAQVREVQGVEGVQVAMRQSADGTYAPLTAFGIQPTGPGGTAPTSTIGGFNAQTGVVTPNPAANLATLAQAQRTQAINDAQGDVAASQAAALGAQTVLDDRAADLDTAIEEREALTAGKPVLQALAAAKKKAETAEAVRTRIEAAEAAVLLKITAVEADIKNHIADVKARRTARDTGKSEADTAMSDYAAHKDAPHAAVVQAKSLAARQTHEAFVHAEQRLIAAQQTLAQLKAAVPELGTKKADALHAAEAATLELQAAENTARQVGTPAPIFDAVQNAAQAEVDATKALAQAEATERPKIAAHEEAKARLADATRANQVATQGEQAVLQNEVTAAKAQDLQALKDAARPNVGEAPEAARDRLAAEVKKRADEIALVEKELVEDGIATRTATAKQQRRQASDDEHLSQLLAAQVNEGQAHLVKLRQLAKILADGPVELDKKLDEAKKRVAALEKSRQAIESARAARVADRDAADEKVKKAEATLGGLPSAKTKEKDAAAKALAEQAAQQPARIEAATKAVAAQGQRSEEAKARVQALKEQRDAAAALKKSPSEKTAALQEEAKALETDATAAEKAAGTAQSVADKYHGREQSEVNRLKNVTKKLQTAQTAAEKLRDEAAKALEKPAAKLAEADAKLKSLNEQLKAASEAEEPDAALVESLTKDAKAAEAELASCQLAVEPLQKVLQQRAAEAKVAAENTAAAADAQAKKAEEVSAEHKRLTAIAQEAGEKATAARAAATKSRSEAKAEREAEVKRAGEDLKQLDVQLKDAEKNAAQAATELKDAERFRGEQVATKERLDKDAAAARSAADAAAAEERLRAEDTLRQARTALEGAEKSLADNPVDAKLAEVDKALEQAAERRVEAEAARDQAVQEAAAATPEAVADAEAAQQQRVEESRDARRKASESAAVAGQLEVEAKQRATVERANVAMAKAQLELHAKQAAVAAQGGAVTARAQAEQELARVGLELAELESALAQAWYEHAQLEQQHEASKRAHVERLRDIAELDEQVQALAAAVDAPTVARRNDLQNVQRPKLVVSENKAQAQVAARKAAADAKRLAITPIENGIAAKRLEVTAAEDEVKKHPA